MSGFEPFYTAHDRGLVAGLRDHGYIEGKNLIIERRYGHLDGKQFSVIAYELAGMDLDAIVRSAPERREPRRAQLTAFRS
jgi:hypothetical protein